MATVSIVSKTIFYQTIESSSVVSIFDIVQNVIVVQKKYKLSITQEVEVGKVSIIFRRTFG